MVGHSRWDESHLALGIANAEGSETIISENVVATTAIATSQTTQGVGGTGVEPQLQS